MSDDQPEPPIHVGEPTWVEVNDLRGGERIWRIVGVQSISFAGENVTVTFDDGTTQTYDRAARVPLA